MCETSEHQSNTLNLNNPNSYKSYTISKSSSSWLLQNPYFNFPSLNPMLESTWVLQYLSFEKEWSSTLTLETCKLKNTWTWLVLHNHMSIGIIKIKRWLYPWANNICKNLYMNFEAVWLEYCDATTVLSDYILLYCPLSMRSGRVN